MDIINKLVVAMSTSTAIVFGFFLIVNIIKAYAESPAWQDKARLAFVLILIPVFISIIFYAKESWAYIEITEVITFSPLKMLSFFTLTYCLTVLTILSIAAWEKRGFDNLNRKSSLGLKNELIGELPFLVINGALYGGTSGGLIILIDEKLVKITIELNEKLFDGAIALGITGMVIGIAVRLIIRLIKGTIDGGKYEFKRYTTSRCKN